MTRIARLGLKVEEFEEMFSRSSGPGGQNVNKVSTAVTVRHTPTGRSVTAQDTRSQAHNRQIAWERLLNAIDQARKDERAALRAEKEKERRRKAPRPWGLKQRILEGKKRRSAVKKMRAKEW
ncbi:peptide chain release factor-like protein [Verrucomicrobiota bacterium sgz303538]